MGSVKGDALGNRAAACSTHRGAGQTLQTSEATVSFQSPLASLSRFSFVTSGALRALGTRHKDTGLVSSGQPHPSQGAPGPCCPLNLPVGDPAQDAQILTGIPRAPAGPEGPMGPCAPCGESGGSVRAQSGQGRAQGLWWGRAGGGTLPTHAATLLHRGFY